MLRKDINGIRFSVGKLDVFEAARLDRRIQEIIPVVLEGIEAIPDGDLLSSDLSDLSAALKKLFEALTHEDFVKLCVDMFVCITAEKDNEKVQLDSREVIGDLGLKVIDLYILILAVMEENGFVPFELMASGFKIEKIINSPGASNLKKSSKKR
jgi:hypothetical protein